MIATAAFEGWDEAYLNQYPTRRAVIDAQLAVGDPVKYPEFAGNVKTMEARGLLAGRRPCPRPTQDITTTGNAETFMLVGDALGRGMIDLLGSAGPDTTPPAISGSSPADNATGVAADANLVLTFNEAIALGTGNITLKNLTDATQSTIAITDAGQVSVTGRFLTINPTADLAAGKNYAIQIDATAIKDLADNPFAGIADDTTWNFTTAVPDTTAPAISTLQPRRRRHRRGDRRQSRAHLQRAHRPRQRQHHDQEPNELNANHHRRHRRGPGFPQRLRF